MLGLNLTHVRKGSPEIETLCFENFDFKTKSWASFQYEDHTVRYRYIH